MKTFKELYPTEVFLIKTSISVIISSLIVDAFSACCGSTLIYSRRPFPSTEAFNINCVSSCSSFSGCSCLKINLSHISKWFSFLRYALQIAHD